MAISAETSNIVRRRRTDADDGYTNSVSEVENASDSWASDGDADNKRRTGTAALTPSKTKSREAKLWKVAERGAVAVVLIAVLLAILYLGHCYICLLWLGLQIAIFHELVAVRIKQSAERRMPMFRTLQWSWFACAVFYTYGDELLSFASEQPGPAWFHRAVSMALRYHTFATFALYSLLFVISVLSLQKGQYRYQISQYAWTLLTCCLVVFQVKAVVKLVFVGLFWFVLPLGLVICNDTAAYISGMTFGRKLVLRPFLELSPNKTWEGFLGGAAATVLFGFWFAGLLSQFQWMICAPRTLSFGLQELTCQPHPMFVAQDFIQQPDLEKIQACLPDLLHTPLQALASMPVRPAQIHGLVLGLFASSIAPFGGFLASAIKRAYGIKDYSNLLPGHGGFMDRMDCQFIMLLCTAVYFRTFVMPRGLSVESLFAGALMLSREERAELVAKLVELN
jgi:phosphatidate cytidylyltransferase